MRVIVGGAGEEVMTPVFSDRIDYVVFRPYWNIPATILHREILPRVGDDDTFLQRNRYEIVDRGQVVSYSPENLEALENERMYLRQRPGPGNSLGLVKFMFPNPFNIYIHDTPADYLFSRTRRSLSHGCIRLHDPVAFAGFVLDQQHDEEGDTWDRDRIRGAMQDAPANSQEGRVVSLKQPLPVYLVYMTTIVRDTVVNSNHMHDLGKFIFAFSIFWTYIWFGQFLLIYYAHIPEETVYFVERMKNSPYSWIFYANLILNFVLPFLLLMTRDAKRQLSTLKLVCPIVLVGHWFDFFNMVTPGSVQHDGQLGLLEIGTAMIFLAAFLWVALNALSKVPLFGKNDPMLEESLHHNI
jgi:hypothetical protein